MTATPPERSALPRATHNPIRTLSSEVAFESPWLRVRQDAIEREDGSTGTFGYIDLRYPVVLIAALDAQRRISLVRQWRYPWQRDSWELPAGRCELGEAPLQGAQRELLEEAGIRATTWRLLSTFYASASASTQFHLFLATGLSEAPGERDIEEQDLISTWLPFEAAVQEVLDGNIVHAASIAAVLRLDRLLRDGALTL